MRIMLTVLGEQGDRDVVIEGDNGATVARVSEALSGQAPLAEVVRLPRARAPYGMSAPDPGARLSARHTRPGGSSESGRFDAPHPPDVPGARDPDRRDVGGASIRDRGDGLGRSGDGFGRAGAVLWRNGRPLDPRALAGAVLRDGDKVTLDAHLARATLIEEPGGVAEVRVVGGPAAGAVHRLGLGVHAIGSDPMCAMTVADPSLAPEAAILRVTPDAITVEPARHRAPQQTQRLKLKGRWADEVAELTARVAEREAAEAEPVHYEPPELAARPLTEAVDWAEHTLLTCGSSVFTLTAIEPQDAHLAPLPEGGVAYNRPPRLRRPEPERTFERPLEPTRAEGMRLQLLAALLPAVMGLTLAYVMRQPYYLLIALMTPLIMIGQWWSDRRHGKKQHRKAAKKYKERLEAYELAVEQARAEDELIRRSDAPDPAQVLLTATGPRRRLWERRIHDPDALRLRVGLADLPANLELSEEKGGAIPPPICRSVPVALAMRRLGVAGVTGPRDTATGLTGWLIGQAATLHSPRDLAIVVLSAHADGERRWGWVRWLPHCAPRGGEDCVALVGTDPESAAHRVAELAALIDERQNTAIPELGKIPTGWDDLGGPETPALTSYDVRPYDVLVVLDGAQVLRGLPGMPQILRQGPRSGVFTLAIDDDQRLLPEECATVAACAADGQVRLLGGGLEVIGPVLADLVSPSWCDRVARALGPIRDVSRDDPAGHLPEAVRLLDLLSLPAPSGHDLATRWHGHGSTKAVIGIGPDGPFSVDLRVDGPHGLIAGTTGAGKSELLQTLICSLAVANRPDQLTFVLVDYKGGAAFKECVRLPHTVGMVSDLDGHLTQRALDSLAAEIRRRERLLLAAGAKDIDDYTGEPLPRLVLIIDEFAALVAELPDFVNGLVDIARRGRSLGIHLILATQRPAGVVTADIQANTSLRIALRVTEPAESSDVIDLPDAAHISKSTPGRCYVKSGVGAAAAVQTARVGGRSPVASASLRADPTGAGATLGPGAMLSPGRLAGAGGQLRVVDVDWRSLGRALPPLPEPPEGSTITDLTILADALIEAARLTGVPEQPSPWLEPLPSAVTLDEVTTALSAGPRSGSGTFAEVGPLAFGMIDRPWAQDRRPLALDLAQGGHLLIAGAARSGRSTALRTIAGAIAAQASPADVHLHAIDCGSGALLPLMAMPHCGAVVTRDQLDRVERLLSRLRAEVGRRQQLLAEAGHASLAEYRQAGHRLPWLVLMVDRWEGYVAAFEGYDYGRLTESLLQLLREGPAVGLRAVVTGDRSCLLGQVSTVFDDRLLLRLADPADYGLAGLPMKGLPASMPAGRALSIGEHGIIESQIALLTHDPSGPAQVAALQSLARAAAPLRSVPTYASTATPARAIPQPTATTSATSATNHREALVGAPDGPSGGTSRGISGSAASPYGDLPDGVPDGVPSSMSGGAAGSAGASTSDADGTSSGISGGISSGNISGGASGGDFRGGLPEGVGGRGRSTRLGRGAWLWEGEPPLRVDALPMRITAGQAMDLEPNFPHPSPLWALIGAGGDALAPMGLDLLAYGPGAVVAGPARSGRSSVLVTAARSLISYGTPVIAIAPRRSPLRTLEGALAILGGDGAGLQELLADRDRYVVIVDDAELINPDSPLGTVLEEVLRSGRDGDHGLIIAGATGDLATAYRGFVAETRKSRTGVLLSVQSPADGDLFTVRLPRGAVGGPPGRGLLITMGNTTPIQAAISDTGPP
ncbi:FtsK/SpoIIIE domain-containing protein [Nonomuraea aurantiaca]|uniref:FtsK/SpoIIIE domain-containing protein n=1 Tax=Nonomuraea aurantiaca TaxID=2878562 RepID=UPI001CD973A8|nr:FtsK/SpoIIIE domain-containing protein [Nonomuraea aurantiaca]MCA2224267.1 cell division protein FtsK [Nonomuraea aurantiaca]